MATRGPHCAGEWSRNRWHGAADIARLRGVSALTHRSSTSEHAFPLVITSASSHFSVADERQDGFHPTPVPAISFGKAGFAAPAEMNRTVDMACRTRPWSDTGVAFRFRSWRLYRLFAQIDYAGSHPKPRHASLGR